MEQTGDSGAEKDRKRGRGWSCLKDNCVCKNKPKETRCIFEATVWNSKVEIRENFKNEMLSKAKAENVTTKKWK